MGLDPRPAYSAHFIGCESLARLGRPCVTVWLPIIQTAAALTPFTR